MSLLHLDEYLAILIIPYKLSYGKTLVKYFNQAFACHLTDLIFDILVWIKASVTLDFNHWNLFPIRVQISSSHFTKCEAFAKKLRYWIEANTWKCEATVLFVLFTCPILLLFFFFQYVLLCNTFVLFCLPASWSVSLLAKSVMTLFTLDVYIWWSSLSQTISQQFPYLSDHLLDAIWDSNRPSPIVSGACSQVS